jgi:hypothetical protein
MERLRVWEKVDAVMASSCRQPQAPVILNRVNSFAGCASCARECFATCESKMPDRERGKHRPSVEQRCASKVARN